MTFEDHARSDEYIGSETCAECHAEAHKKWEESHHFHAMEIPSVKTVRADFNGSTFDNFGVTSKFYRKNDKYMVETENELGEMQTFEIAYTFGWEPLQQYLVKVSRWSLTGFAYLLGCGKEGVVSYIS